MSFSANIFRSGLVACLFAATPVLHAYVVAISNSPRSLFLQVGAGTMTGGGGTFANGGTPGNNSTVNSVSVDVPATSLGGGVQAMTTDSAVENSPYDNFVFCSVPEEVYVAGYYRRPGNGGGAILSATSPTTLSNGLGDTIAFTSISWISGGMGDTPATIPSGTFVGGVQTVYTIARNNWFESCLTFNYANNSLVPAGTFTGRVTYTLTAP